jgi:hypothetical protein
MKQAARRATPLPKAEVYIEKLDGTARKFVSSYGFTHRTE